MRRYDRARLDAMAGNPHRDNKWRTGRTLAQLPARFGVHPIAAPLGTRQSVLGVMAFIDGFQNERTLRGYPIIKCGHDVML